MLPIGYAFLREQFDQLITMMCLTFDFQFIATEDEEKALEGGAQTKASRKTKRYQK